MLFYKHYNIDNLFPFHFFQHFILLLLLVLIVIFIIVFFTIIIWKLSCRSKTQTSVYGYGYNNMGIVIHFLLRMEHKGASQVLLVKGIVQSRLGLLQLQEEVPYQCKQIHLVLACQLLQPQPDQLSIPQRYTIKMYSYLHSLLLMHSLQVHSDYLVPKMSMKLVCHPYIFLFVTCNG